MKICQVERCASAAWGGHRNRASDVEIELDVLDEDAVVAADDVRSSVGEQVRDDQIDWWLAVGQILTLGNDDRGGQTTAAIRVDDDKAGLGVDVVMGEAKITSPPVEPRFSVTIWWLHASVTFTPAGSPGPTRHTS